MELNRTKIKNIKTKLNIKLLTLTYDKWYDVGLTCEHFFKLKIIK